MNEPEPSSDAVRLLEWANVLLAHRFLIVLLTIAAAAAAYGISKKARPLYTAEATVIPNREAESRSLERLLESNLAPNQYFDRWTANYVSSYYTELLRSDSLLRPLANRTSPTLAAMFDLRPKPRGDLIDQVLLVLRKQVIKIRQDAATGMLSIQCTTPDPALSADLANSMVAGLKELLKKNREAGTSELVKATEERTSATQRDLRAAEMALKDFRMHNKTLLSPELQLKEDQLVRNLKLQDELFLKLWTQREILRVSGQQDTALINVIQPAEAPLRKSWPPTLAATAGAALFGFLLAVLIAFIRHGIGSLAERRAPGYEEFARHVRSLNHLLPGLILLLPAGSRMRAKPLSARALVSNEETKS